MYYRKITVTRCFAGKLTAAVAAVTLMAGAAFSDVRPETAEPMSGKTALQFFADNNLRAGWNLGNTMDARGGTAAARIAVETAWGNPLATQELFNGVAQSGFDLVRIPITWIGHIGSAPDYTLNPVWLQRAAEIIDYAKNAGIKSVIINIHHDGNCTECNNANPPNTTWGFLDLKGAVGDPAIKNAIQNQIGKVWTQIADYFKNYGDYLIFETMNEVHSGNWGCASTATVCMQQQDILFDWNKAALDAIRATGGNNAARFVAIPSLGDTEPEKVISAHGRNMLLPNDPGNGTGKLIVKVHSYKPKRFTVEGGERWLHTWDTPEQRAAIIGQKELLKTVFIDNGIAVYIGEWGAPTNARRNMDEEIKNTHIEYIRFMSSVFRDNSLLPIYWDDGGRFKLLERTDGPGRPQEGFWKETLLAMMGELNPNSVRDRTIGGSTARSLPTVTVKGRTLNISTPANSDLKVRMIDVKGKVRASFKVTGGSGSYSTGKMPAGRYFVEVKGAGVKSTSSIVLK